MIQHIKRVVSDLINKTRSNQEIFSKIYKKNYWGGESDQEFYSGEGTYVEDLSLYTESLLKFIQENQIKSICEIGCGDFHVSKKLVENISVNYTGIDVVPDLVNHLNQQFASESINFICLDAASLNAKLPQVDLCIIRQVLQHLNNNQIHQILKNTSHIPNLIITEHVPVNPVVYNSDKVTNGYIRLQNKIPSGIFLDKPPFNKAIESYLLHIKLNDKNADCELIEAELITSWIKQ
jgi:SAM-dependent methyltransferase